MEDQTITQLNNLTQEFYTQVSTSFSQTRQTQWQGWQQLAPYIQKQAETDDFTLLDLGCGNGRFLTFVCESGLSNFTYVGTDTNQSLLREAQQVLTVHKLNGKLLELDIITALTEKNLHQLLKVTETTNYDLIVSFGVLHHIPSAQLRIQLVKQLLELLKTQGIAIISLWRFNDFARYQTKKLDPNQFGVSPDSLEPNDFLLGWKDRTDIARYCHSFTQEEVTQLLDELPAELVTSFTADGKEGGANIYLVLQKK